MERTHIILGPQYGDAWFYLTLMALGWLYVGFGGSPLSSLLMGRGETRAIMKAGLVYAAIGVAMGYILIPWLGITGLIITGLVNFWSNYLILIREAKRFGVTTPILRTLRIYAASIIAVAPTYALSYLTDFSDESKIILGIPISVTLYIAAITKLRAIDVEDLDMLRSILTLLPFGRRSAEKMISWEERRLRRGFTKS